MRTLNEITDTIKESFVNDETMAQMYGLDASKTFDEQFSLVSFEAVLIYIVAMASYLCERLFLTTSDEVTAAIDSRYIASEPWFQQRAIEYQDGYSLIYNPATYTFEYAEQDEAAAAEAAVFLQKAQRGAQVVRCLRKAPARPARAAVAAGVVK